MAPRKLQLDATNDTVSVPLNALISEVSSEQEDLLAWSVATPDGDFKVPQS